MTGTIVQVSTSAGGVPKLAVPEAWAGTLGLTGDGHNNPRFHGGPRQALLLVADEDLEALKNQGFPIFRGALGENLTIQGLDFRKLRTGMRFRAGPVLLELTKLRTPCATLDVYGTNEPIQRYLYDKSVKNGDFFSPLWARGGVYAAVLAEGLIRTGDIIKLLDHAV